MVRFTATRSATSPFPKLVRQIFVGTVAVFALGTGGVLAQGEPACPTPLEPNLESYDGRFHGFSMSWNGSATAWAGEKHYQYKRVDDTTWIEAPWTPNSEGVVWKNVDKPPTEGANPGLYEVQVRGTCEVAGQDGVVSGWSPSSRVNASEPPQFVDRLDGNPLPDNRKFCIFSEGSIRTGQNGNACRILGYDPDGNHTKTFTIGGPDGDLFTLVPRTKYDDRTTTGETDTGGEWRAEEDGDHYRAESIRSIEFKVPPDFENTDRSDNTYTVTITLTDEYELDVTGDWTIRVLDQDEPETWSLAPETPRVGETVGATVTDGDTLQDLDFLWESSADVTPRQWQRIPESEQATYTPETDHAGRWLRVIVRYTDVGGPKEEVLAATAVVADNTAPSFAAATETRTFTENPLPDTAVGAPIVATDTSGDVLTYTLSGTDTAAFAIDAMTGQLRTVPDVEYDFEAEPAKTSFVVTVTATDQFGAPGTVEVTITLTNVDENGEISGLSAPQVGMELMPTLSDGATTPSNQQWQWQSSADNGSTWANLPHGQFKDYVPRVAQQGQLLRVRVTYDSPENSMLRELAEWTDTTAVAAAATGGAPLTAPEHHSFAFPENQSGDSTTPALVGALPIRTNGGALTLEIVEPGISKFTVADGNLQYIGGIEDYETLSPPEYPLRIKATSGNLVAYTAVTVAIENVEEVGEVVIDAPSMPRPGRPLVATLTDGDGPEDMQWQWQERAEGDTGWRSIAGATYREFVPWRSQALLTNNRLRALVTYVDGQSGETRRTVMSEPTGPLQPAAEDALRVNQPYMRVRLPERVADYASTRERILLHSFLPLGEDGRPAVPRAPVFRGFDDETDDYDCNDEDYCWVNNNYSLRSTSEYTYSIIDGNAENKFEIHTNGNLYYVGYGEDYEAISAVGEPQYRLRVQVSRNDEHFQSVVLVEVENQDDPGVMTLTPAAPIVGAKMTATVTDPDASDNELRNLQWGWGYIEATPTGEAWHTFDDAISSSYVPTAADVDRHLVAIATYNDPQDTTQRRVEKRAAGPVVAATPGVNQPPAFTATPEAIPDTDPSTPTLAHYIVPDGTLTENESGADTPISLVTVLATDGTGDTVTYSLATATPAGFVIDSTSGRLTYEGAGVDFEHRNSYLLTVIASDQHDNEYSDGFATVYVPVTNVAETESVVLTMMPPDGRTLPSPETGVPIVARLQGGDAVYTVNWQWQRSPRPDGAPDDWDDITDATDSIYIPTSADENEYLRAMASYHDVPSWASRDPNDPSASLQTSAAHVNAPVYLVIPIVVADLTSSAVPTSLRTFIENDEINVTVTFNQPVTLNGELRVTLEFDDGVTREATHTEDGTAPAATEFELAYTVGLGDRAASGFNVRANSLALSGTLQNERGYHANLDNLAYTVSHSVHALAADFPDTNRDTRVNGADGLTMFYAAAFANELGDGTADGSLGSASLRATFLNPLLPPSISPTDANFQQLLRSTNFLLTEGGSTVLDVNMSGVVDRVDAAAIYYVLTFPELVGDGQNTLSGFDNVRRQLLSSLLNTGGTPDQSNLTDLVSAVRLLAQP